MMRSATCWLFLTVILITWGIGSAEAQDFLNTEKQDRDTVMVLNFESDTSPSAPDIAIRMGWMLRKKLRAGGYELPEIIDRVHGDMPVIWANRFELTEFFQTEKTHWLLHGVISDVDRDPNGKIQGPRVFGVAGIPVKANIEIYLFDCRQGIDVWKTTKIVQYANPRLRVFGINGSPLPSTPRAIDAMIHDTVMALSRELISVIDETANPAGSKAE